MIIERTYIFVQTKRFQIKKVCLSYKTDFNQYFAPRNGTNFRSNIPKTLV